MSRHALIRGALKTLSATRAERWLPAARDAAGFVITLHHVRPEGGGSFRPNALLSVAPEFLDRLLGRIADRGWRIVPVDQILQKAEARDPHRIAITLDDGYRDNLEHAWPVFRRHNAPFTIYVCPGFTEATADLWWEALERIIAENDSVTPAEDGPGMDLPARTHEEKQRAFRVWSAWLTEEADEARQRRAVRALCDKYRLDLAALARELVMSWDEVRRISADPLCTIGAHTMTHPALARLSPQAAFREMHASAERIAGAVGKRPTTIAFPYGSRAAAGPREAELAEQAGFAGSFTTRPGFLREKGSPHGAPRVSVNGLVQDERLFDVLLTPGLWDMRDRLTRSR
jgi:peptidoglycan/xylan/chitin deacetylase (PgdA/CDA1 family)